MYLIYSLPLLMLWGRPTFAARWTIDSGCDNVPFSQRSPLNAVDELKKAMAEAITMAENAVKVLNEHADDEHVSGMMKLIYGDGNDYQAKVDETKRILANVAGFEKEKAGPGPLDQEWQNTMTNNDVMIFCSKDRFKPKQGSTQLMDTSMNNKLFSASSFDDDKLRGACYKTDYDLNNVNEKKPTALTTPSDLFDKKKYNQDGKPPDMSPYMVAQPKVADTIDICPWLLHRSAGRGWPRIDKDQITKTQQPGFKDGLSDIALPVDGLVDTGYTLLHELTHTKQGGRTIDTLPADRPAGAESCYGWKCVQLIKDPKNADNIAKAGMALHLWTMGYHVDKDGNVLNK
ncbi:uncharacterized protein EI97DRAFT_471312 [Westerdykella ornata]|uniref:Lysine-specific metallo-endopeptidase domain-containing protein n=1 Tax=Westerdykella ornata TaxID=318751 RepID=A0A6A6J585_WESOR|nr:uncharacterized protein EI97DRAFT_471312 [Westerdykella ornata]KAF2271293.1 hypothetical protein EI97DRAFT_471312 [Westerdykella ornata]